MATSASPKQRRQLALAGLLISALAIVLAMQFGRADSAGRGAAPSNRTGARTQGRAGQATTEEEAPVLDVELHALDAEQPEPSETGRNPFRFQPRPAPPPPVGGSTRPSTGSPGTPDPTGPPVTEPPGPPVPPPPPPIPLKFIGIIDAPGLGKVAALTDGRTVFHGKEGQIVDGRYRIVKIGVESIVMEYADGRGRQTIRLSG